MVNANTELIGLFGHPVSHSKSPLMHNAMFHELGLNYLYLAFDVQPENLQAAIAGVRALGFRGLNITIPHKEAIIPFLDEISPEAKLIGAVNTVVNSNGKLIGYNTDGEGYLASLLEETGVQLQDKKIIILGAGGAARAISYALAKQQVKKITIINRDETRAEELVLSINNSKIDVANFAQLESCLHEAELIINTTSVGMSPNITGTLVKKEWINPQQIVSDIIYNPLLTKLLSDADAQGATIHEGLGMFINQGAIAFEKWTEIKADSSFMRQVVLDSLI